MVILPVRHRVRKDIRAGARRTACALSAAAVTAAFALLTPVAASATPTSTQASSPPSETTTATVATLSNLKTLTRWAYPQAAGPCALAKTDPLKQAQSIAAGNEP